jgi:hypothetical protein
MPQKGEIWRREKPISRDFAKGGGQCQRPKNLVTVIFHLVVGFEFIKELPIFPDNPGVSPGQKLTQILPQLHFCAGEQPYMRKARTAWASGDPAPSKSSTLNAPFAAPVKAASSRA